MGSLDFWKNDLFRFDINNENFLFMLLLKFIYFVLSYEYFQHAIVV